MQDLALEREPLQFRTEDSAVVDLAVAAGEQWTKVVSKLENLHQYALPDEVETARDALQGIIGEVTIVEEGPHIIA